MVIVRNAKAALKLEKNAIAAANILLGKYDPETVCKIIWNKYGFLTDVTKHNTLKIGTFAEIEIGETK